MAKTSKQKLKKSFLNVFVFIYCYYIYILFYYLSFFGVCQVTKIVCVPQDLFIFI